ncbi:glycosyltransferase family protein [Acidicapsa ligni]|uniref:glycosyltransferase family protein n=1 Tax=Acidicapsa ligni TaxID=542300 RepID=UPI0021DF61C2|nr:glycosyltransferase [Acidicapsa ligni]
MFLADMASWGVDTFFTLSVSMAEYTPEIADRLFVWPNFADDNVYKDYSESKNIPVLFTGSLRIHYPWRNRIYRRVSQYYPTLTCPHFGWFHESDTARMLSGERYARLLNSSSIVPACGTIANEVVRKHFEVPGSMTCLLAERSQGLEAAGFVDMVNCVFAEEHNVLDKLDYLFTHSDELKQITSAGHDLVHSAHTIRHRDQLYQWFCLQRALQPNQRIIQPGPFERLVLTDKATDRNSHVCANGIDRELLKRGYLQVWTGRYAEANTTFLRCLNYHIMPEPKLGLVISNLLAGDARQAQSWCIRMLETVLEEPHVIVPDPVEWAYFILMTLCRGKEDEALSAAMEFPQLHHRELDRVRLLIYRLRGIEPDAAKAYNSPANYSVHKLPELDVKEWFDLVCRMLKACDQSRIAERAAQAATSVTHPFGSMATRAEVRADHTTPPPKLHWDSYKVSSIRRLQRWGFKRLRHVINGGLRRIETRVGYFLPYKVSKASRDDFFQAVEALSSEEQVSTVVLIGARHGNYVTDCCLHGLRKNPRFPSVICVSESDSSFEQLQRIYAQDPNVSQITKPADPLPPEASLLLVIDGSELMASTHYEQYRDRATVVVLEDINQADVYEFHRSLTINDRYALVAHNSEHRNGYAILRKRWNTPSPIHP